MATAKGFGSKIMANKTLSLFLIMLWSSSENILTLSIKKSVVPLVLKNSKILSLPLDFPKVDNKSRP